MSIKRKTIFLDQGETLGGAERFLLNLFQTIDPATLNILNPVVIGAENEQYKQALPEKIRTVDYVCPSLKGLKLLALIRLFWASLKLKKIIKQESQNVRTVQVFANTPRMMMLAWFLKFLWRCDFRLMVMVHDFTIPKFVFNLIAKKADTIIVNAVITRQVVRDSLPAALHERIMIVENGVDFSHLPHCPREVSGRIKNVVLLGRIDPRKGQLFALEAAKYWKKHNLDVSLSIVGSPFSGDMATEKYEKILHQRAKEWDLERVNFVSEVETPWEVFSHADLVLVLPTEPETFGRVVIEAMALNKPVIVFDEMGPREIMKHFGRFTKQDVSSFICPKNAVELAKRVQELVENPERCSIFWQKGEPFVRKYFDQVDTKKQFVNILLG
ncbi:hypothetical protein CSB37_01600 [bacterium DOLZORAL124_38_8]|nr:MAG: hypothetical protein CSB37_01600 [bacterium DOLZORAL124_38_8]